MQGAYGTYEPGLLAQLSRKSPISHMSGYGSFSRPEDTKYFFPNEYLLVNGSPESMQSHGFFVFGLLSKLADMEMKQARC